MGAKAADALSKADFGKFTELVPDADAVPRVVSRVFKTWMENPVPDDYLGKKIVLKLKANGVSVLELMC